SRSYDFLSPLGLGIRNHSGRSGKGGDPLEYAGGLRRRGLGTAVLETSSISANTRPGMTPRAPRKNVMLAASISASTVSAPVRIRNLSEAGAMIDGPALPDAGSTLMLNRLELSVTAVVVWN